jgi:hypothetical protein
MFSRHDNDEHLAYELRKHYVSPAFKDTPEMLREDIDPIMNAIARATTDADAKAILQLWLKTCKLAKLTNYNDINNTIDNYQLILSQVSRLREIENAIKGK